MELFDYQRQGVKFVGEVGKAYLAFDMGMGKTYTALHAAKEHGQKNVLVVAELNEIERSQNFRKEVEAHFPDMVYLSLREEELPNETRTRFVCGINPEALAKFKVEDLVRDFDAMILDEATLAKTTTSERFKRIWKIARKLPVVVLLSGTPMMNGAAEIFAPLVLLGHWLGGDGKARSRMAFEKIFAGGNYKPTFRGTGNFYLDFRWTAKGANNLRELRWLVQDRFIFRQKGDTGVFRTKERKVQLVPVSDEHRAEYEAAWDEYLTKVHAHNRKAKDGEAKNVMTIMELQKLIENGQCLQVNSRYMAKRIVSDIASGVYEDRRVIVWSLFIETDRLIQEELTRLRIPFRTFDELSEWKGGTEPVLVGRIKSHAKGGNVPQASASLFADMDFVPTMNIQAENRMDRPEQTRDMVVRYYMPDDPENVAKHVQAINRDKMRKIDRFMAPFTEEEAAGMEGAVEVLMEKYAKEFGILRRGWESVTNS